MCWQNWHCSVCRPTYWHTMNSSFKALAAPSTWILAATVEKNGTGCTCVCKSSPVWFPSLAGRVLIPSPRAELRDFLLECGWLVPVEAGLQQGSFDVLDQCCLGWRQVLKGLCSIWEEMMSGFVYPAGTTALAVHDDDHTLQSLLMDIVADLFRVQGEGNQGFCEIGCCLPSCHCTPFPIVQEGWGCVASC